MLGQGTPRTCIFVTTPIRITIILGDPVIRKLTVIFGLSIPKGKTMTDKVELHRCDPLSLTITGDFCLDCPFFQSPSRQINVM
jgi:hypothetical protein